MSKEHHHSAIAINAMVCISYYKAYSQGCGRGWIHLKSVHSSFYLLNTVVCTVAHLFTQIWTFIIWIHPNIQCSKLYDKSYVNSKSSFFGGGGCIVWFLKYLDQQLETIASLPTFLYHHHYIITAYIVIGWSCVWAGCSGQPADLCPPAGACVSDSEGLPCTQH